jgi:hypothetical protein
VPVIFGTTSDEWRLFIALNQFNGGPPVTAADYQAMIASTLGVPAAVAAVIAAQYPQHPVPRHTVGAATAAGAGHAAVLDEPRGGWHPRHPRFTGTSPQVLSLVPPLPQVETDYGAKHHCSF